MFKLLGADQKEYGPVNADQIRKWIAQGRANARTKLQAAGSAVMLTAVGAVPSITMVWLASLLPG